MKVNLYTDAPHHNLALMQLSACHKAHGDQVTHQSKQEKRFKRFIDSFMWRKYKTIDEAWKNYRGNG